MGHIIGSFRKVTLWNTDHRDESKLTNSQVAVWTGRVRSMAQAILLTFVFAATIACPSFIVAQERVTLKIANRSQEPVQIGIQSIHRAQPAWVIIPAWGMKEVTLVSPDDFKVLAKLGRAMYSTPRMPLKQAIAADPTRVLYANRIFGAPEGVQIEGFEFKLGGPPKDNGDDSEQFESLPQEQEGRLKQEIKRVVPTGCRGGPGAPAGSSGGRFGSSGGR